MAQTTEYLQNLKHILCERMKRKLVSIRLCWRCKLRVWTRSRRESAQWWLTWADEQNIRIPMARTRQRSTGKHRKVLRRNRSGDCAVFRVIKRFYFTYIKRKHYRFDILFLFRVEAIKSRKEFGNVSARLENVRSVPSLEQKRRKSSKKYI